MKIAIHYQPGNNFSPYWKQYCEENKIPHKIVNCYENDIIDQLRDCDALMWHINNFDYRDQVFAKYVFKVAEEMGLKVFPKYDDVWHYDDKVAQKYLLEGIGAPFVKTFVFYDKTSALKWASQTKYPTVFKLRRGSGSKNVLLVKSERHAKRLIRKMFGKGIKPLSMFSVLSERFRKFREGKESYTGLIKGILRLFIGTPYLNMSVREKGYVYFQEFQAKNSFDFRIYVLENRVFGAKRITRKNDFRASGSGNMVFYKDQIDPRCVRIAREVSARLGSKSLAFDFVYDEKMNPKIIEISCVYNPARFYENALKSTKRNPGYWNEQNQWVDQPATPMKWMIEDIQKKHSQQ